MALRASDAIAGSSPEPKRPSQAEGPAAPAAPSASSRRLFQHLFDDSQGGGGGEHAASSSTSFSPQALLSSIGQLVEMQKSQQQNHQQLLEVLAVQASTKAAQATPVPSADRELDEQDVDMSSSPLCSATICFLRESRRLRMIAKAAADNMDFEDLSTSANNTFSQHVSSLDVPSPYPTPRRRGNLMLLADPRSEQMKNVGKLFGTQ